MSLAIARTGRNGRLAALAAILASHISIALFVVAEGLLVAAFFGDRQASRRTRRSARAPAPGGQ